MSERGIWCDIFKNKTWAGQYHCGPHGVWFRHEDEAEPEECPAAQFATVMLGQEVADLRASLGAAERDAAAAEELRADYQAQLGAAETRADSAERAREAAEAKARTLEEVLCNEREERQMYESRTKELESKLKKMTNGVIETAGQRDSAHEALFEQPQKRLAAEARAKRAEDALASAIELAEDAFTQHGDDGWYAFKYGDWFREELAKCRAALAETPAEEGTK